MNNTQFSTKKISNIVSKIENKWEKSYWLMVLLAFVGAGYIFFLSSSVWAASMKDYLFTPPGTSNTVNKREITLLRWDYSPSDGKMEMELSIKNDALDGNNAYVYELADRGGKTYTLTAIIATPTFVVVQADGIPSGFTELSFRITPNLEDAATLKFYTNKNDVNRVEAITVKTEEEYYIGQLERTIAGYEAEKAAIDKNITDYNGQIEGLKSTNAQLERDKTYQIESQIVETDKAINANSEKIKTLAKQIEDGTARKLELDRLITEANDKIALLQAGINEEVVSSEIY